MLHDIELVSKIKQKACSNDSYGGCSQAVLAALQDGLNIGNTETLKAATALPGGRGWRGETCGALLGALMALGIVIGREKLEDTELKNWIRQGILAERKSMDEAAINSFNRKL